MTPSESPRYSRHLSIDGFTKEHQNKINQARILVVGAGALGSVAAVYLAAAGVGKIGVVDFDTVDETNLQRQVFYSTQSLGCPKVRELAEVIGRQNPQVNLEIYELFLRDNDRSREIITDYDIVIEGTDNPNSKLLVEKMALEADKPVIIAGVSEWSGQVMTVLPGHATFRDVFGDAPGCDGFTPCSAGGVLGPVPGIIATLQAVEALKLVTGLGQPLVDRMLTVDTQNMIFRTWELR